jgi:hypothetical protein
VIVAHVAVLAVYVCVWMAGLHSRNRQDKRYALRFLSQIERVVCDKATDLQRLEYPKREWWGALWNWSPISEILITSVLLVLSIVTLSRYASLSGRAAACCRRAGVTL